MLQLILHDSNQVQEVFPGLERVTVTGNTIRWVDGELQDIKCPFIVISNSVEVEPGQEVTDLLPLDRSHLLGDPAEERLIDIERAIINLYGGGSVGS